jgi:hypothetical protein
MVYPKWLDVLRRPPYRIFFIAGLLAGNVARESGNIPSKIS